jgi:asparagine synthase (glutamine-hydrolysing)
MCGIFCIYNVDKFKVISQTVVETAIAEMHHRGPDDDGIYLSRNVGLGHKRLSIIDLSAGHQPMFNEDKQVVVVYNGEIYNHTSIRKELISKGHIFKTVCDTEAIIHSYEEWGVESVKKFNGMFSYVIFDKRNETLTIVRDRIGIKPLYYYWDSKTFICSSEIKPIFATGLVEANINKKVLDSFFSLGYVPGPETMFKDIYKLSPGNYLQLKGDKLKETEYWDFADIEKKDYTFSQATEIVEELIVDSVGKRLMSDVPIGAFLSGGLDSSSITALMSKMINEPINTFTVGYDEKYGINEENYARLISEKFKTKHFPFRLDPENFFSSLQLMVKFSEEPIVESPAIALYHLSKLAREKAIVLLSGEGADEVFSGYLLYHFMDQLNTIQKFLPVGFWKIFNGLKQLIPQMKYRKYLDWLSLPLEKRYQGTSCYLTESIKKEIYSSDFYQTKGDYLQQVFERYFNKIDPKQDPINKMLYVDTKTWLVDDLLLKADKMTMAASIELRVPFLDHRLVELSASLPASFKCKNGNEKYILKKIMGRQLPGNIISRKKMGFPVPTSQWFGDDLLSVIKNQILDTQTLPWFDRSSVEKLLNQHQKGLQDHSRLIMTLLVLTTWQSEFEIRI